MTNSVLKPETFRLPQPPEHDPFFGLSRSAYYELEEQGKIRLLRIRKRGKKRGTTLVPYDAVRAFVLGLQEEVRR
jgi:hypothetical protein